MFEKLPRDEKRWSASSWTATSHFPTDKSEGKNEASENALCSFPSSRDAQLTKGPSPEIHPVQSSWFPGWCELDDGAIAVERLKMRLVFSSYSLFWVEGDSRPTSFSKA